MSTAFNFRWSARVGLLLGLFGCHACSSSSGGSEPASLTGLSVTPGVATVAVNLDRQLTATATYSDNSSSNKTAQTTWTSTAPGVATVAGGLVSGVSVGTAQIIGALGAIADTANITVTSTLPSLSGLIVNPDPVSLAVNGTRALAATAHYSDSSTSNATSGAAWSSTNSGVATVIAGLVTGVSGGTANVIASLGGFADTSHITVSGTGPAGYVYPVKMGPTSRYLVDQNGKPFFLAGDAAWSLIAQLSDQDADTYLTSRQQLGFTLVLANLIEHQFATNAPADIYNLQPFTDSTFGTPNEAYFAHVDHILQSAAQKGITVLLGPAYVGYQCGSQGWASELSAASTASLTAYGQYLGTRYKNFDNIIWLIGGDADPGSCGVSAKLTAIIAGIQANDNRHLFTAHNNQEQMAIDPWPGASWLTVNDVYTYSSTLYQQALSAYQVSPTMPFFLIETAYEGEHGSTAQGLRAQSYWTVLSGGFGHVFGNCPIWNFGSPGSSAFCSSTNWQAQLNGPGSKNIQYLQQLFTARHWYSLVPDTNHAVLTAGFGTFGQTNYVTAAVAADGSSIIAYLPSARTVTVNGSLLGSSMTAWWYNPGTGTSSSAGTVPTNVTHDFAPPGAGDWVLVIDNSALNFPAP